MSSLSDAQQLHAHLQEICKLLDEIDIKTAKTEENIRTNSESFKDLERVALRYLALANRMGLPSDIQQQVSLIARLIVLVRAAQIAIASLEASTGPVGLAMFAASGIMLGLSVGDTLGGYT